MDDIVKQALAKWPNVPDCYGWLGLDARGHWYLRDDAVQAAGLGELDKRKIHITSPIKAVGEHEATVRLRDDLTAVIILQVVAAK